MAVRADQPLDLLKTYTGDAAIAPALPTPIACWNQAGTVSRVHVKGHMQHSSIFAKNEASATSPIDLA